MPRNVASSLANAAARCLHRPTDLGESEARGAELRALFNSIAVEAEKAYPGVDLEPLLSWYGKLQDRTIDYGVTDVVFTHAPVVAEGRIMPLLKELGLPAKQLRRAYRAEPSEEVTGVVVSGVCAFVARWGKE